MKPVDLDQHAALLEPHLTVVRPEGEGPFPVALQLHGCGGIQPMQMRYAEAARDAGFAAVVVDSLAPRGIGRRAAQFTVCTLVRLRAPERATDLFAMLHWLKGQPWAKAGEVAAAGWSHGGWTIMDAMAGAGAPDWAPLLEAVKTAVLVYPYAGPPGRTARFGWGVNRPEVYGLVAGRDAVVGAAGPRRALARLKADGLEVNELVLDDATHCFDDDGANDPRTVYRPDLEEAARRFYVAALEGRGAGAVALGRGLGEA